MVGETDLRAPAYYGIAFSNYTDPALIMNISSAILQIIQNGQLDELNSKWRNQVQIDCSAFLRDQNIFDIRQLQGLFYVLIVGVVFGFIGVFIEYIFRRYIYKPDNKFLRSIHKFLGGDTALHNQRFSKKTSKNSKKSNK